MFFFSEAEAALYRELWHACAGPLVTVPREGELVFYFPQGHIEQVTQNITDFPTIIFHGLVLVLFS